MNNIKNTFRAGLVAAAGLVAMYSCTDTWNEHYGAEAELNYDGTTMQAIEENASDFAKVIKAYGYDRELASENVYTIWAPANGSFVLSDYIDAQGNMIADSATVVRQFIKNHIARYAYPTNGKKQDITLMSQKLGVMTDETFVGATMTKTDLACKNGVLHLIDTIAPYNYNLFELIEKQYKDDTTEGKDTCSLYAYLYDPVVNKDTLIESKSVSRGVDENGDKIWVDSFVMKNNTVLKTVDAKVYEEDSSFIAIIPTAKAWAERYEIASKLLNFNPNEDAKIAGTCDSLRTHYANTFVMTDLFYNRNNNEHWLDSLKSTQYSNWQDWEHNVYYSKEPKHMPEDKGLNDILSKCGDSISCSNGIAYIVDEYPMSIYEQFFKRIKVRANGNTLDITKDANQKTIFTKNVQGDRLINRSGTALYYKTDTVSGEITKFEENYNYGRAVSSSQSLNPYIGIQIPNTLSGTYDIYVVTCPIWVQQYETADYITSDMLADLDTKGYRFYCNVFERDAKGEYPTSGVRLPNPDGSGSYFTTNGLTEREDGSLVVNDTTYLGAVTLKNAYYGRNNEGVILQLQNTVTSSNKNQFSRDMIVCCFILKPHQDEAEDQEATEAKKPIIVINSNKND